MQIRTVTVSAQRKLPNPNVDFANISAMVSLQADLAADDDPMTCIGKLQEDAEAYLERHLDWVAGRLKKQPVPMAPKAQVATASTADALAEKYAGAR